MAYLESCDAFTSILNEHNQFIKTAMFSINGSNFSSASILDTGCGWSMFSTESLDDSIVTDLMHKDALLNVHDLIFVQGIDKRGLDWLKVNWANANTIERMKLMLTAKELAFRHKVSDFRLGSCLIAKKKDILLSYSLEGVSLVGMDVFSELTSVIFSDNASVKLIAETARSNVGLVNFLTELKAFQVDK